MGFVAKRSKNSGNLAARDHTTLITLFCDQRTQSNCPCFAKEQSPLNKAIVKFRHEPEQVVLRLFQIQQTKISYQPINRIIVPIWDHLWHIMANLLCF